MGQGNTLSMRKSVLLQKHSAINNGSNRRHQTERNGTERDQVKDFGLASLKTNFYSYLSKHILKFQN